MEPPPFAKRTLRPTASLPTTAETYGEKHGIDPEVQRALQNVGWRSRQTIAHPSFARTATTPNLSFGQSSSSSSASSFGGGGGGFQTSHEIMEHARGVVNKDAWRRSKRELQPYGSNDDIPIPADTDAVGGGDRGQGPLSSPVRGKRRASADNDDEEEEGEGTEVDEDEDPPALQDDDTSTPSGNGDTGDEFPAVFQSPHLTQPELFARPALPTPRPQGRQMRGLPARGGRQLGKTVSAPVGHLFGHGAGHDVDMDGREDGFDISEWAKEEF